MSLIWAIIIGWVAGLMGKDLKPGEEPRGFWVTGLLGVAGAVLAYLAGASMGWYRAGQPASYVAALVGATTVVMLFNTLRRLRTSLR